MSEGLSILYAWYSPFADVIRQAIALAHAADVACLTLRVVPQRMSYKTRVHTTPGLILSATLSTNSNAVPMIKRDIPLSASFLPPYLEPGMFKPTEVEKTFLRQAIANDDEVIQNVVLKVQKESVHIPYAVK